MNEFQQETRELMMPWYLLNHHSMRPGQFWGDLSVKLTISEQHLPNLDPGLMKWVLPVLPSQLFLHSFNKTVQ